MESQTVVITGASAGIGRATARLFGERGARVGLIARGEAGLEAAAREVEERGGKALAVSADMADFERVTQAAASRPTARQLDIHLLPAGNARGAGHCPGADIVGRDFGQRLAGRCSRELPPLRCRLDPRGIVVTS